MWHEFYLYLVKLILCFQVLFFLKEKESEERTEWKSVAKEERKGCKSVAKESHLFVMHVFSSRKINQTKVKDGNHGI